MSLTTNEMTPADIAAVTGNGYGNGMNGDGWWIILFLILAMGGNWGGNGFGGGAGNSIPWFMNTDNDVERGFDQMATTNGIQNLQTTVSNGFANAATQLCNCCSDMQMTMANGFAGVEQSANARQMADMNQNFALQTAMMQGFNNIGSQFADCCCENRLGIADLKYTVATENCTDRYEAAKNTTAIMENCNRNNQEILDKLCQLELDGYKRENDNLRTVVNMQNLAASQVAQTAQLISDNTAQTQYIVNRVAPYPVPSYTVPNPFTPATGA